MELHLLFESSKPIFGIGHRRNIFGIGHRRIIFGIGHRRNIFLKIQSLLLRVPVEGEIPFPRRDWARDCRPEVAKQFVIMMVWKFLECNEKSCLLIYKRQFSNAEWSTVIDAKFSERIPLIRGEGGCRQATLITDIHICKCSSDSKLILRKEAKCAYLAIPQFHLETSKLAQRALT